MEPDEHTDASRLVARGVTLGYGDRAVVDSLSCDVPDGQVTVIVGANACGKSTLLRGLARLLRPSSGSVLLDGKAIGSLPSKQVARILGLLPQNPVTPEGVTVVDLVGRGRHPHQGAFRRWSTEDEQAVAEALELTDTLDLADRLVDELSGGQRQRVWIAMALAQQTDLLLLDEPTTYLDVAHQVEVLDLLADLNETKGTTIVMVLHDLNLAARYADYLIAMSTGAGRRGRCSRRGDHRGLRAHRVRHGVPGHRRPRHRHAHGGPAGPPLPHAQRPEDRMSETEDCSQCPDHRRRRALRDAGSAPPSSGSSWPAPPSWTSARTASTPGSRWCCPGRPASCRRSRTCRRTTTPRGWELPTRSGRRCAPTRSATSSATARTCGWSSTSWCTTTIPRTAATAPGPACRWALGAQPGDVIQVIAPHRLTEYGGTEFDPGDRRHLLLIGDETAVPALTRILADLGPGYTGEVFVEVPTSADILDLPTPSGFETQWFTRNGGECCRRLVQEVRRHLGLPPSTEFEALPELPSDLDIDVWETPRYSSAGEDVEAQLHTRSFGHDLDDTYAWIAGESWMVKALRRSLVTELGVERAQVAFMGYWREGVAMKG